MNSQALRLALIVSDPVLRSGLEVFLAELPQVQQVSLFSGGDRRKSQDLMADLTGQDILFVDNPSLDFCELVRRNLPDLPLLIISDRTPIGQISGPVAYCTRLHLAQEIPNALDSLAKGRNYYTNYPLLPAPQRIPLSPWRLWQNNLRVAALERIDRQLSVPTGGRGLEQWIMEGRKRELRTAKWLVQKIFPQPLITPAFVPSESTPVPQKVSAELTKEVSREITKDGLNQLLLTKTNHKIRQYALTNLTPFVQEIDILRPQKRQQLLLIVLHQWELLVRELDSAHLSPAELEKCLSDRTNEILLDLWQQTTVSFIGKYFSIGEVVVVERLLTEAPNLDLEVPQLPHLLLHLLTGKPLTVDNQSWTAGTPTAIAYAEILLEHLLVSIANAVIQPLLNHFAHAEVIKRQFYGSHLLGTREIERFRNDLSWKYRRFYYLDRPQAIFESRYRLFCLTEMGIRYRDVYAPRTEELAELRGIAYAFTLLLELQDAVAPRLKSLLSWVGSGVVYVLTNIIGRGLGLIGRGVLQGIGSAFRG